MIGKCQGRSGVLAHGRNSADAPKTFICETPRTGREWLGPGCISGSVGAQSGVVRHADPLPANDLMAAERAFRLVAGSLSPVRLEEATFHDSMLSSTRFSRGAADDSVRVGR